MVDCSFMNCGCGFESRCCDLNVIYRASFEQGVPYIQAAIQCRFTLECVRNMIITYSRKIIILLFLATCKQFFVFNIFLLNLTQDENQGKKLGKELKDFYERGKDCVRIAYFYFSADVGGFFGNPEPELLVRWYQVIYCSFPRTLIPV